jgi:hypothetical protein
MKNEDILKEKTEPTLDNILKCRANWLKYVNKMQSNVLPYPQNFQEHTDHSDQQIEEDLRRDYWVNKSRTGQQLTQLLDW